MNNGNRGNFKRFGDFKDGDKLDLIGFSVMHRPYSKLRDIMSELGESDTILLRALKAGHDIEFDSLHEDPELYFVIDQEEVEEFARFKISPTWMQIFGNCRIIALDEQTAIKRFRELMQ
jgi:hypothetical protein